jgi:hypothetical protein
MACVEETAKLIEGCEGGAEVEHLVHQFGDEEDVAQVDASPSDLMGREKLEVTLRFGSSLIFERTIQFYVDKGYVEAGVCRP